MLAYFYEHREIRSTHMKLGISSKSLTVQTQLMKYQLFIDIYRTFEWTSLHWQKTNNVSYSSKSRTVLFDTLIDSSTVLFTKFL